jgi:hypothetical protein
MQGQVLWLKRHDRVLAMTANIPHPSARNHDFGLFQSKVIVIWSPGRSGASATEAMTLKSAKLSKSDHAGKEETRRPVILTLPASFAATAISDRLFLVFLEFKPTPAQPVLGPSASG